MKGRSKIKTFTVETIDNVVISYCEPEDVEELEIEFSEMGKENRILKKKNVDLLEVLKCIENILNYEININNYDDSEIEELQEACSEGKILVSILVEQMESWK